MNSNDWKNATPEQLNLWNYARGLIAFNTITPLYYQGEIAGSEFLIYAATKLYIALEFTAGSSLGAIGVTEFEVSFYDHLNVANGYFGNTGLFYDVVGSNYYAMGNYLCLKNLFFGRIDVGAANYNQMKFNGYRLDII